MRFYKQRGDYDCGITSLQSVLTKFGIYLNWQTIFDLCQQMYKDDIRLTGTGVKGMRNTIKYVNQKYQKNLRLRIVGNYTVLKLRHTLRRGAGVIINGYNENMTINHFMVAYDYTDKHYRVWDPGNGRHKRFTKDRLNLRWTYNGRRAVVLIYDIETK